MLTVLGLLSLIALGAGCSSVSAAVTPPMIADFSANSPSIASGESVTLAWNVIGATAVAIDPVTGSVDPQGTRTVSPKVTTTYTLMALNNLGSTSKTLTVIVGGQAPQTVQTQQNPQTTQLPPPPVINQLEISPSNVKAGQTATLTWNVSGSDSVTIEPSLGTVGATGSKIVTVDSNTTYILKASNAAGAVNKALAVRIDASGPPPDIIYFEVFPDNIASGPVMVKWKVAGATTVKIDPGIGPVTAFAQDTLYPKTTTTYTLTATNAAGTVTATGTVTVANCGASATCPLTQNPPN
jgi:hypothetical protein